MWLPREGVDVITPGPDAVIRNRLTDDVNQENLWPSGSGHCAAVSKACRPTEHSRTVAPDDISMSKVSFETRIVRWPDGDGEVTIGRNPDAWRRFSERRSEPDRDYGRSRDALYRAERRRPFEPYRSLRRGSRCCSPYMPAPPPAHQPLLAKAQQMSSAASPVCRPTPALGLVVRSVIA